jgi:hypothetical protein
VRSSSWSRLLVLPAVLSLIGIAGNSAAVASAQTAPSAHRVHPGAAVSLADVRCTVGLLLHQGKTVYAGIPASCAALGPDEGKEQNGCKDAASAPTGTHARVAGARHRATLMYDSFTRMQLDGTTNSRRCQYNDLALLKLSPADARSASGAIPSARAPKRVSDRAPTKGSKVVVKNCSATTDAGTHRGWVYPINPTTTLTTSDVGAPVVRGTQLVGMLIVLPAGVIIKTAAEVYNLHRALILLRRLPKFRHVALLRAGQHP